MASSDLDQAQKHISSGNNEDYMVLNLDESESLSVDFSSAEYIGAESLKAGYKIHHIYVQCKEVKSVGLPLEANPREPDSTRQVKAMRRTLDEEPDEFVKKNNGVVVICSSIEDGQADASNSSSGGIQFEFNQGEGVCNGGHTYFAIQTSGDISTDAKLHLETIVVPDITEEERKDVITEIAKARNNSNQLERRSEADFLGYYEHFKDVLSKPELVRWHENDSDANDEAKPIDAVHFLRLLKSLDISAYNHPIYNPDANTHKSLATSRTRFHNDWIEQVENAEDDPERTRPLTYLLPIADDVMYIRDMLSYSFPKRDNNQVWLGQFRKTNLWEDYVMASARRPLLMDEFNPPEGVNLKSTLEVLFIGLFRSNLFCSLSPNQKTPAYVGWLMDPEELWKKQAPGILEKMGGLFTDLDTDPKQFIRINAPYNENLYEYGMEKELRPPDILYAVDDRTRYEKVEQISDAEYWMQASDEKLEDVELIPVSESEPPRQAAIYAESPTEY